MLSIVGDDELDIVELPNGMKIHMEFGIDENGPWNWRGRITGRYRRIQLCLKCMFTREILKINPIFNNLIKFNKTIIMFPLTTCTIRIFKQDIHAQKLKRG